MLDELLFIGNQGFGALERLVHFTSHYVITDGCDVWPCAWRSLHQFTHQNEIGLVMQARIARGVHELDGEIDALGRSVSLLGRHDVFFAQYGGLALDKKAGALIAVGDDAIAENKALA